MAPMEFTDNNVFQRAPNTPWPFLRLRRNGYDLPHDTQHGTQRRSPRSSGEQVSKGVERTLALALFASSMEKLC